MLNQAEVAEVLSNILALEKKSKSGYKANRKPTEYYPIYCKAVDFCEKIEVHSKIGEVPEELLKKRSPNQSEAEAKYIRDNYKQVTLPVFNDYMSTVNRMWNDGNWDIKYKEDSSIYKEDSLQKYIEEQIFIHGSLEAYFKTILTTNKVIDANALLVIRPRKIDVAENELLEPIPFIYESEDILAYEEGEYYLYELEEKSIIEDGNVKVKDGRILELVDKTNFWRLTQIGKKSENKYQIELYFSHNLGVLPCDKLKGIPTIEDGYVLHQSPFLFAVDILDDVILDSTYLRASKAKCVFPYQYMIGDVCEFDNGKSICNGGKVMDEDGQMINCSNCGGSGLKSRISPLGTLLLRPKTKLDDNDSSFTGAPIGYVAPSTETLEFLKTSIAEGLQMAKSILQLKRPISTVSVTTGNMTATENINDTKAMYAFIQNISNQTFDLFSFAISAIGRMRYGDAFQMPEITYPKTFDFRTEQDYTDEISTAIKNGLPDVAIYSLIYSYINTRFSSQKETIDIFTLILVADRVSLSSNEDIVLMEANRNLASWERILHDSAISFITDLKLENPNFFEQEMTAKVQQLQDKAKAKASEVSDTFGAEITLPTA